VYIQEPDETGYKRLLEPDEWTVIPGYGSLKNECKMDKSEDFEEIMPISKRAMNKNTSDAARAPAPENPGAQKKARAEIDLVAANPGEVFEARANYYAVQHLLQDKNIQDEAIRQGIRIFEPQIKASLLDVLERKELEHINSDANRREAFRIRVEQRAMTKLLTDNRQEIYEKVQANMQREETQKVLAFYREGAFKLGPGKPIPADVANNIRKTVDEQVRKA
jgi:hypothetical protein